METMNDWVEEVLTDYYAGFDVQLEKLFSPKAVDCITQSNYDDIDDTVLTIMDMAEAYAHFYRFDYVKKTDVYSEYDGAIVNAPTEKCAWFIFLGMAGEFKIPSASDYSCTEETSNSNGTLKTI